jgi:hypothetical protein
MLTQEPAGRALMRSPPSWTGREVGVVECRDGCPICSEKVKWSETAQGLYAVNVSGEWWSTYMSFLASNTHR